MKSGVLDYSAKIALVMIMVCSGLFVSCYEKEEIDLEGQKPAAVYYIAGVVTDYSYGGALKGAKVKVTGDFAEATTGENGEFSIKLGAITPAAEGYTVTYSRSGYKTATKQVYISAVGDGLSSITTASIALRAEGSTIENPPAPAVDAKETEATEEDKAEVIEKMADVFTEEVKAELKNEIANALPANVNIGNVTFEDIKVEVTSDGKIQTTAPVTFANAAAVTTMTYPYTQTTGFEVVGGLTVSDNLTRAIDQETIDNFEKSAANELNMPAGFSSVVSSIQQSVPTGYKVAGFKIIDTLKFKEFTFLINGQYVTGNVSYFDSIIIVPLYESHNGDRHDAHGFNPNAGGGSSI